MVRPATRDRRRSGILTLGVVLVIAVFLAPLMLAFLGSLRPMGTSPPTTIDLFPGGADLSSYGELVGQPSLRRQTLNSLLVAAISVPAGTLVASWAGFAIARLPRRAALFLLGLTLVTANIHLSLGGLLFTLNAIGYDGPLSVDTLNGRWRSTPRP